MKKALKIVGAVIGVFIVIGIISAIAGGGSDSTAPAADETVSTSTAADPTTTAPAPTEDTAEDTADTEPDYTMSQQNAIEQAKNYLDFSPFSKQGLIQQLHSKAGSGFPLADARFAVNHIDVDWKQQAVKAAKSYLDFSSFSRQGLIQQLESKAGSGFTHEQAVYAANQVGL